MSLRLLVLSWEEFYEETLRLAEQIEGSGFQPEIIVGIARGGLVVARLLSDFLNVPEVATLRIVFYKRLGEREARPKVLGGPEIPLTGKRVLLVDDIVDTGGSMRTAVEHVRPLRPRELRTATLHRKPWARFQPDYCVREVDAWVVYPYEHRETIRDLVECLREQGIEDHKELRERILSMGMPAEIVDRFLPKVLASQHLYKTVGRE